MNLSEVVRLLLGILLLKKTAKQKKNVLLNFIGKNISKKYEMNSSIISSGNFYTQFNFIQEDKRKTKC